MKIPIANHHSLCSLCSVGICPIKMSTGHSNMESHGSMITQEHENTGTVVLSRRLLQRNNSMSQETQLTQESGLTTESILEENALSTEEKKRRIQEVYYGRAYKEENKYEVNKVKKIVRENIFKHVKFCIGEGSYGSDKNGITRGTNKSKATKNTYGQSHEYPDLTLRRGYAYEILSLSGNGTEKKSLSNRALWWKTYSKFVKYEVRQIRSNVNYTVKKSCMEGEFIHCCLCCKCIQKMSNILTQM